MQQGGHRWGGIKLGRSIVGVGAVDRAWGRMHQEEGIHLSFSKLVKVMPAENARCQNSSRSQVYVFTCVCFYVWPCDGRSLHNTRMITMKASGKSDSIVGAPGDVWISQIIARPNCCVHVDKVVATLTKQLLRPTLVPVSLICADLEWLWASIFASLGLTFIILNPGVHPWEQQRTPKATLGPPWHTFAATHQKQPTKTDFWTSVSKLTWQ